MHNRRTCPRTGGRNHRSCQGRQRLILSVIFFFASCTHSVWAQNTFRDAYEAFKRNAEKEYEDFRQKANQEYADFVRKAWEEYQILPAVKKPKEEERPPVIRPKEDKGKPVENTPIVIDEVVTPPQPEPQPLPVAPIKEQAQPEPTWVSFVLFGTDMKVRFNDGQRFTLPDCQPNTIAKTWERMATEDYNNTIRDCLELRIERGLSDWTYLLMLQKMAEACMGKGNEASLLMAFVYCQSGYEMRLGMTGNKLYMLYASRHEIYDLSYFMIDDERFYPFDCKEKSMEICGASFPDEEPLSLLITNKQSLAYRPSQTRTLTSEEYPGVSVKTCVNQNLMDFYNTYPSSKLGDNFMTRWALYANTPMAEDVAKSLYPALQEKIKGISQKEAMERLLNFTQTAFVYEYDDKVWGDDRAFFAEETLFYPYCDCEDRSIFLSRLVRDLLGLKVILVYYPGHLAMAVKFTEDVKGDYIQLNGERYVVCDPTYIGAPVGMTMPDMDNATAKVILLE